MTINADSALLLITVGVELVAAVAFLCVPLAIAIMRRRRPDLPEPKLLRLLGLFVGLVGLIYLLDALGQFGPQQALGRWVKVATIFTSLAALVLIYPAARRLLSLPSRQSPRERQSRAGGAVRAGAARQRGGRAVRGALPPAGRHRLRRHLDPRPHRPHHLHQSANHRDARLQPRAAQGHDPAGPGPRGRPFGHRRLAAAPPPRPVGARHAPAAELQGRAWCRCRCRAAR